MDANGKITQADVTRPGGAVRRVTFNAAGYTLSDTLPLGPPEQQTLTLERQAGTNLVLARTDALGRRTAYTYDALGNVASITRLAGTAQAVTTSFTWEATFSQLTSVTDPLGHTTSFGYDTRGTLTSVTDPLGRVTTLAANAAGQPTALTDPLLNTTQFSYDLGDLVQVTDPLGRTTTRFVDGGGRVLAVTDPLGRTTRFEYDFLNRLTKLTDPAGGTTLFTYDANGNLLSVRDARGGATSYAYDSMDRLSSRTDPLLKVESYSYDAAGDLTQGTDRKGQVTVFTYDRLHRRTFGGFGRTVAKNGTVSYQSTVSYTWDGGNRLTQVVDSGSGTITRTYDGLDRPTQEGTPQGTVSYTWDAAGRRTGMTVLGQPAVSYTYDAADRLTGLTRGTATVSLAYDAAGRRTSLTLPNGVVVDYAYDAASQLTGLTYRLGATVLGNLTYAYDRAGQRTQVGGTWARTALPAAVASATYNAANQLTAWGAATLTYDANGNLTSDGTLTYAWDARNRLTSVSQRRTTLGSFQYDALGHRIKKTLSGTATELLHDGLNPVQELNGATVLANLLTGLGIDEFFQRTDSGGARTFLTDALGSTVALTDASGLLQTEYTYEPFGDAVVSGAASSNSFEFTGREFDASTGLYYSRARYYHPQLQRFISEDPIGFLGGDPNLYAYVRNSPLNAVDPFGLFVTCAYIGTQAVCYRTDNQGRLISGPIIVVGDLYRAPQCGRMLCFFENDDDFFKLLTPGPLAPTEPTPIALNLPLNPISPTFPLFPLIPLTGPPSPPLSGRK